MLACAQTPFSTDCSRCHRLNGCVDIPNRPHEGTYFSFPSSFFAPSSPAGSPSLAFHHHEGFWLHAGRKRLDWLAVA